MPILSFNGEALLPLPERFELSPYRTDEAQGKTSGYFFDIPDPDSNSVDAMHECVLRFLNQHSNAIDQLARRNDVVCAQIDYAIHTSEESAAINLPVPPKLMLLLSKLNIWLNFSIYKSMELE